MEQANFDSQALSFLDAYRDQLIKLDAADELFDAHGNVRQVWHPLVEQIFQLKEDDITDRLNRGNQYLRDAGVFYRQYEGTQSTPRDWPLSPIPVIIDQNEWNAIEAGVIQRANLLEAVVRDIYQENQLVANGHLPAQLIAANKNWLRSLVGVQPRSGHYLHFLAFEIGRAPDGNWWVLSDLTEAPAGAGFAIENRVATAKIFPEVFAASHVQRLANFFRQFKETLLAHRSEESSRIGILSPGMHNDVYFEHSYIARYLGFLLVEGEDLTVRNGQVMVRTVQGLQPISVLWRRMNSSFVDPLELDESSLVGTSGLVGAVRNQSVMMANALGSGILEARFLQAFLPRLCQTLFGEPLLMPNVATWWCGQEQERQYVLDNLEGITISGAQSVRLPLDHKSGMRTGNNPHKHADLRARILDDGQNYVAQENIKLSSTPAWANGTLVPRPMALRVYLSRTEHGWQLMPGGYARIGTANDPAAISLHSGGGVADVWVSGPAQVPEDSLLKPSRFRESQSELVLPSRAAENLFWLGRYVQRAEDTLRMLRAYHVRFADGKSADTDLLTYLNNYLEGFDCGVLEQPIPETLIQIFAQLLNSASRVRDMFSVDGWTTLSGVAEHAKNHYQRARNGDNSTVLTSRLLRDLTGFAGLVHENMYQSDGWRFLKLGRKLEAAVNCASMLETLSDRDAPPGSLDAALEIGDSVITYRRLYSIQTSRAAVLDLLALDDRNPRSLVACLARVKHHIACLPYAERHQHQSPLSRQALITHARLAVNAPDSLSSKQLNSTKKAALKLSDLVHSNYFR